MSLQQRAPLESRTFKFKDPHMEFYCPLCGTQRAVVTNPHLNLKNYFQMTLITVAITACLSPVMGMKGIFSFFIVWACFEAALRLNFRKEVPCPHCGFDAAWYKKDVNVAREKVDEFWKVRNTDDDVSLEHTHNSDFVSEQNYEEDSVSY
ncbi:MAG: hypothetical protein BM556_08145 [Bacteriovorax sp. MedPE-SWde]|nr:MAG: hypothetical protein BM556_08145 [Bacteriovorax sp. MedPE-SWde]